MSYWRTIFDRQAKPQKPSYPVSPVVAPVTTTTTTTVVVSAPPPPPTGIYAQYALFLRGF